MNADTRAKIQKWIIEKSVKDTGLPVMPVSETTTDKIVSPIPAACIAPVCAQEAVEKAAGSKVSILTGDCRETLRGLQDSYLSIMSNTADILNCILKGCKIIFLDSMTGASSPKSVNISLNNERTPQSVFSCLFSSKGKRIKNRNDNFSEVVNFLASPGNGGFCITGSTSFVLTNVSTTNGVSQIFDCTSIIFPNLNSNCKAEFAILKMSSSVSHKSNDTSLSVEESREPSAKFAVRWHSTWNTFTLASKSKGIPDVDFVNQSISLQNSFFSFACLFRDFRVTSASEEQLTLTSIGGNFIFTISDVGHLMFSFKDGSVIPYRSLYYNAIRMSNRNKIKQVCSNCGAPWIKSEPSCSCNYAYPGCTVPEDDPAYMPYPSVPGTVLDCFGGSGTTGEVSKEEGRNAVLCELNPEYVKLAEKRSGL